MNSRLSTDQTGEKTQMKLTAPVWADDAATVKGYESFSAFKAAEGIGEGVEIISCGGVQVPITEL